MINIVVNDCFIVINIVVLVCGMVLIKDWWEGYFGGVGCILIYCVVGCCVCYCFD